MSGKKNKSTPKPQPVKKASVPETAQTTLLAGLENWCSEHQKVILPVVLLTSFLFSLLLFDVKISEANDDSLYIEGGYNFAQDIHHAFTANAPLYPLLLSIPIKLFGLHLVLLKSISVIFTLLHILFLYLAFRKRIPFVVLIPVMFIVATNSYFQYFASQTFTESLFMFLQALFVYYFFKAYDQVKEKTSIKESWKQWLLIGFFIFLLSFCKNIAVGAIGAIILFFLFEKKYLYAIYAVGGFIISRIPFEIIKKLLWGASQNQFGSQTSILLQKDPYDPSKGQDDISGFIQRFLDNFNLYISKRLFQILGFRSPDDITTKGGLVLIFFIFIIISAYWIIKNKQKVMGFVWIYFFIMMSLMFTVLQTRWDQPRMIMVYVPFMLLAIFYGMYAIVIRKSSFMQFLYLVFVAVIFFSGFFTTIAKSVKNYPVIKKNIAGDVYYGYTPDWINFLKLSKYCSDSLPPKSYVASRKAPMSFVYGNGKKFYPVYTVFSGNPDTVLNTFKRDSVTHIMVASLRRNPKKLDGYVINTIQRLLQPLAQKYPYKLTLVKQIGESEQAYLYKINY
ncbi:MAG: glycosyltransferase family 39 protein [Bacteroidia bacterium]